MKIFMDDGSTAIKLAFNFNDEKKTIISPNSFKHGWSVAFGNSLPLHNYTLEGENYTFDPISPDALTTTNVDYQYSDLNVIAIHHALLKSGLEAQDVDLVVTLPLTEYYNSDNQPNTKNIQKKISNVMRPVTMKNRKTFIVKNVTVLPESIPAGFEIVKNMDENQSLLIIDLGGTTLDISQVQGKMTGISKILGNSKIGVSIMTNAVKEALAVAKTQGSSFLADNVIINRNIKSYLQEHINDDTHASNVEKAIKDSQSKLIKRTLAAVDQFGGYTHVMVIGGGAEIISDAIKKHITINKDRFFKTANPQLDLVNGMYMIG